MILVYNATQLSLAGLQGNAYAVSLDLANNNIKILEFCGQLDPVARRFSESLSMHYDRFRGVYPASHSDTLPPSHFASDQSSEYLFTAPAATAVLYNTSQKLFEQLCNPHGNDSAVTEQSGQDARPRHPHTHRQEGHRECPSYPNCRLPGEEDTRTALTARSSNLGDGYFVASNEPSSWCGVWSAVAYSNGATTLEIL